MANKKGERLAPRVGENGHLYFNYGIGAKYVVEDRGVEYALEIKDCRYTDNKVEYYKCTNNGEPFWNEFTANRLHHILHFGLHETISEGKRREIPLTIEEVNAFAYGIVTARAAAVQALKSTDYFSKEKELKSIGIEKAFAEVKGQSERLAELTEREKQLRAKQKSILQAKKIDPFVLSETVFCTKCNETGILGNKICDCAKKIEKEIKDYNAILRRRQAKEGAK